MDSASRCMFTSIGVIGLDSENTPHDWLRTTRFSKNAWISRYAKANKEFLKRPARRSPDEAPVVGSRSGLFATDCVQVARQALQVHGVDVQLVARPHEMVAVDHCAAAMIGAFDRG